MFVRLFLLMSGSSIQIQYSLPLLLFSLSPHRHICGLFWPLFTNNGVSAFLPFSQFSGIFLQNNQKSSPKAKEQNIFFLFRNILQYFISCDCLFYLRVEIYSFNEHPKDGCLKNENPKSKFGCLNLTNWQFRPDCHLAWMIFI